MDFSAAILAGGHSSRFGRDKALYPYAGKPLLSWVAESLTDAAELFIIANKAYPAFDFPLYSDIIPAQGPLSGIHAGLSYSKQDWLAVAACDMPFLTRSYWQLLMTTISSDKQIVIVEHKGRLEPLAAYYHKSCLALFEANLNQQQLSLQTIIRELKTTVIPFETLGLESKTLANINYLEDLQTE
ncbi:MAG: molybdenum cofactor guanylyltransferase [Trueperaceae bacterium]|nr:molybdenum cofactor guanylyltransferase [Trueperaceae bacterium]